MDNLVKKGAITLKMLRYFSVLAEELHFGNAAKRLCISQPPLSVQIRELEAILGFTLFDRNSRNVKLTKAGHIAYQESKNILCQVDFSLERISYAGRYENHHLILGLVSSVLGDQFFAGLRNVEKYYPNLSFNIAEILPKQQLVDLKLGKIDFAFIRDDIPSDLDDDLHITKLFDDNICVAYNKHLDFPKDSSVSISDLKDYDVVILGKETSNDALNIYSRCLSAGLNVDNILEVLEPFSIMSFIRTKRAVALVPQALIADVHPDITYKPLKEHISSALYVAYSKQYSSDLKKDFVKYFSTAYVE